jgi:hypothetical protein
MRTICPTRLSAEVLLSYLGGMRLVDALLEASTNRSSLQRCGPQSV